MDVIERTPEASGSGSDDTIARKPSFVPATRVYPFSMSGFEDLNPPAQSLCSPSRHSLPQTNNSTEPGGGSELPIVPIGRDRAAGQKMTTGQLARETINEQPTIDERLSSHSM